MENEKKQKLLKVCAALGLLSLVIFGRELQHAVSSNAAYRI